MTKAKSLHLKAFGVASGVMGAFMMLSLGIAWMMNWGAGVANVGQFIASFYVGFNPTAIGILIGAVWGFLDLGIGGLIFAWVYNRVAK